MHFLVAHVFTLLPLFLSRRTFARDKFFIADFFPIAYPFIFHIFCFHSPFSSLSLSFDVHFLVTHLFNFSIALAPFPRILRGIFIPPRVRCESFYFRLFVTPFLATWNERDDPPHHPRGPRAEREERKGAREEGEREREDTRRANEI